jgi:hypothetical protein
LTGIDLNLAKSVAHCEMLTAGAVYLAMPLAFYLFRSIKIQ